MYFGSIHEDAGLTPGLAQWIGDLVLPWAVCRCGPKKQKKQKNPNTSYINLSIAVFKHRSKLEFYAKNSRFIFLYSYIGGSWRQELSQELKGKQWLIFYLLAEQKYTQYGIFIRQRLLFYISHWTATLPFLEGNDPLTKENHLWRKCLISVILK